MAGPKKARVLCSVAKPLYERAEREAIRRGTSIPAILMEWAERGEGNPSAPAPIVQACPFTVEPVTDAVFDMTAEAQSPFAFAPAPGRK